MSPNIWRKGKKQHVFGGDSLFVLQQALPFRTCHHLCRQGVLLVSTRRPHSQGPASVQAHRDVNGHGDGDGAGAGTGVEVNEEAQDGNGDKSGDGAGTGTGTGVGTRRRTPDGNEDGNRVGSEDCSGDGNENDDNGNENRTAEGRRKSARNRKIVVDAVRETGETRVESEKNVENKGLVQ